MMWECFRELYTSEYLSLKRPTSREKVLAVFVVFEQLCNPTKLRSVTERTISAFLKGMTDPARTLREAACQSAGPVLAGLHALCVALR